MRNFLNSTILSVFSEFYHNVTDQRFCNLKTLRFDGGNVPNYCDLTIQQLYLLRYLAGYTVEYFLMYSHIFSLDYLGLPINILSLGAGPGIDFYGAYFATKNYGIDSTNNLHYTGIDRVDWSRYQDKLNLQNVNFLNIDLADLSPLNNSPHNIFMFPKSISEFDDGTFNHLQNIFSNSTFLTTRMCIISSIRDSSISRDSERVNALASILANRGFTCLDNTESHWKLIDPGSLRHYMGGYYRYPDEALDFLKTLNEHCVEFTRQGTNCHNDCKDLARWPMLKTELTRFQCLRFERT